MCSYFFLRAQGTQNFNTHFPHVVWDSTTKH